jgi:acetate kinase
VAGRGTNSAPKAAVIGNKEREISADGSRIRAMVMATNEQFLIARDNFRADRGVPNPH